MSQILHLGDELLLVDGDMLGVALLLVGGDMLVVALLFVVAVHALVALLFVVAMHALVARLAMAVTTATMPPVVASMSTLVPAKSIACVIIVPVVVPSGSLTVHDAIVVPAATAGSLTVHDDRLVRAAAAEVHDARLALTVHLLAVHDGLLGVGAATHPACPFVLRDLLVLHGIIGRCEPAVGQPCGWRFGW